MNWMEDTNVQREEDTFCSLLGGHSLAILGGPFQDTGRGLAILGGRFHKKNSIDIEVVRAQNPEQYQYDTTLQK